MLLADPKARDLQSPGTYRSSNTPEFERSIRFERMCPVLQTGGWPLTQLRIYAVTISKNSFKKETGRFLFLGTSGSFI